MRRLIYVSFTTVFLIGLLFAAAFAESYPNSAEGIKCATLPPPGIYYKMTNAYITADKLIDSKGNKMPVDFDAKIFATVQRLLWVTKDIKFFGADYGFQLLYPLTYKNIEIGAASYDDSRWAFGDLIVEPFVLGWHKQNYDVIAAIAFFLPTADHDDIVDPGEDMLTTMLTLGATYCIDKPKTWAASILGRYEIHHDEYRDTDITPGDDFHFEWAFSKTVAQVWEIGMVGYCQWQVTQDSGSLSTNDKDRGFAVGPEICMYYPPMKASFSLRSEFEFSVRGDAWGRAEGNRTVLTIIKIF